MSFQKYFLLSQEEMERIRTKQLRDYNPQLTSMARVQEKLEDAQLRKDLPPETKLKEVAQLQNRFDELKTGMQNLLPKTEAPAEVPVPAPAGVVQPVAVAPSRNGEQRDVAPAEVENPLPVGLPEEPAAVPLVGIDKRNHAKATRVWTSLTRDPSVFSVADNQEIIVRGERIPGSNIFDLMSDAFTLKRGRMSGPRPSGFEQFRQALIDSNAPTGLFSNPLYSKTMKLRTPRDSGISSSSVLHMY